MESSIPAASPEVVDAQISRCADARLDSERLRTEVHELKALAHPRAHFAAALFELDRARKGDPDARAGMLDVADSLLAFWKDESGSELASSHPALEELWGDAVKLLSGFAQKRFARQLDTLWEARADATLLAQRVADLGVDDDRRSEFVRCLYHLELARQYVDGSRVEFARRAALVHEAYLDKEVAEELVGGDPGLLHLWGELLPYLDEFFETLEERAAAAAAARAAEDDEVEAASIETEVGNEVQAPSSTAPLPSATPGDGRLPMPVATPYASAGWDDSGEATLRPGTRFPAPRDTAPPPLPYSAQPQPAPPMPPSMEPRTAPQVPVVTAPVELPDMPPPPPDPSVPDAWPGLASLRTAPVPTVPEGFDVNKTLPMLEAPPPLPVTESHLTQPIELPHIEVLDEVEDVEALSVTLPPHRSRPPPPDTETLDPDLVAEMPPPPPTLNDSSPRLQAPSSPALEVVEDDEPEPGPVTQAFWRGTEAALGLLPPVEAPRLNTRVFAADHRNERKKLTTYLEDVKTRFTEAEVPESRAMQCMLKLYLAAHLKEKTLFGSKNEKRSASFKDALSMLGRDPMAAAHCAVWFELDGPKTLEKFQEALEVLTDYLQYCSRNALDPLAPTSPALFLG